MNNYKKPELIIVTISWFVLMGLLACFVNPVQAQESGESRVRYLCQNCGYSYLSTLAKQETDREFTIKFSQDVDVNTINSSNIELIEKETGSNLDITFNKDNSKEIKVTSQESLIAGKTYYFIVHDLIESKDGKQKLKRGVIKEVVVGTINNAFQVQHVNFISDKEVEIKFNELLNKESAATTANYCVNDMNVASATVLEDGRSVKLGLNNLSPTSQPMKVFVSGEIQNIYMQKMGSSDIRKIYLNAPTLSGSEYFHNPITGNISMLQKNGTLKYANVSEDVYIANDNITLENVVVAGTVFINTGSTGSVLLDNVEASRIEVLSGADGTGTNGCIELKDVEVSEQLLIKSRSQVKVTTSGSSYSTIFKTVVELLDYNVTLERAIGGGSFGRVEIAPDSQSGGTLNLKGYFDKSIKVYQSATIKNLGGSIPKVEICPENRPMVIMDGDFGEVDLTRPVRFRLHQGTINLLSVNTIGVDLLIGDDITSAAKVQELVVGDNMLPYMDPRSSGIINPPLITTVAVAPGSARGTTSIITLAHPTAISFMYKVQGSDFTAPGVGQAQSELVKLGFSSYTPGQDINAAVGQHLGIIALNRNGQVIAFTDHTLQPGEVAIPKITTLVVQKGSRAGRTMIITLDHLGAVSFQVQVQEEAFTEPVMGAEAPAGFTAYHRGDDIVVASAGLHLGIIALDEGGKVIAFTDHIILAEEVENEPVITLLPSYTLNIAFAMFSGEFRGRDSFQGLKVQLYNVTLNQKVGEKLIQSDGKFSMSSFSTTLGLSWAYKIVDEQGNTVKEMTAIIPQ